MTEKRTQIYLIRHGQGYVNVQPPPVMGPQGDTGLTALGIAQAERLRDRLAAGEIAADLLLASNYRRAAQTAEIIAPALGLSVQYVDELQEFRLGEDASAMTPAEFKAKYTWPDYYQTPFSAITPASETLPQFWLRIGTYLDRLIREHRGKTIVLLTHGGFVEGAFTYFFNLSSFKLPPADFDTLNTSITHWGEDEQYGQIIWRLYRYNDALHLRGLENNKHINWRDLAAPAAEEQQ